MIKLTQIGPGVLEAPREAYDAGGTGSIEVQTQVTGSATYRVEGRVDPAAPWAQLLAPQTAPVLQKLDWLPWLRLVVTAGTGTVTLWAAEVSGSPVVAVSSGG